MAEATLKEEHAHWSESLARRVVAEKKQPFIITSGMTTSGPCHLGTLCEFMFPSAVQKGVVALGHKAKFIFVADILDAFDSVPSVFQKYSAMLEPHLGKPLCDVPDPTGEQRSFGDHFLHEAAAIMGKFSIKPEIIRAADLYASGAFDEMASDFLGHEKQIAEMVARTSLREGMPADWSPIMPICQKCGKIATTTVTWHDSKSYKYSCNRDVKYTKGCGFEGENKLSDHKYKLTWRLHWPAWMRHFGTSAEGAGMDHHTRGGSWDTCKEVFEAYWKAQAPISYKFGFILFNGKKYSKSKGIGMGVSELLELLPTEVLSYLLLRPDLQENIDIVPTGANMLRLMDDYSSALSIFENASAQEGGLEALSRADRKRAIAASLSSPNKRKWTAGFTDVLLYFQLYRNWDTVSEKLGDKAGVEYLKPHALAWVAKGMVPGEYSFELSFSKLEEGPARKFVESLSDTDDPVAIHNKVFETAKAEGAEAKTLFAKLYLSLLGKEKGPKLGKLVYAIGVDKVKKEVL
ncbi:MAG: lysine--tRNA ligase [Candidatus Micrarchaeia archaeon]